MVASRFQGHVVFIVFSFIRDPCTSAHWRNDCLWLLELHNSVRRPVKAVYVGTPRPPIFINVRVCAGN